MTFDAATGNLWIADVGLNGYEEVNRQPAGLGGRNYGWSITEGARCTFFVPDCDPSGVIFPVVEYAWAPDACAVIGGYVYRGTAIPDLFGRYLFTDFCGGRIWSVDATEPDARRNELTLGSR